MCGTTASFFPPYLVLRRLVPASEVRALAPRTPEIDGAVLVHDKMLILPRLENIVTISRVAFKMVNRLRTDNAISGQSSDGPILPAFRSQGVTMRPFSLPNQSRVAHPIAMDPYPSISRSGLIFGLPCSRVTTKYAQVNKYKSISAVHRAFF